MSVLDAKIHAKSRTFLMFLRETLVSGPALGTGHRDYQAAPVSGVSPRPGIAPQIPGDIGHEPRSEHRGETARREREYSQGEEKRAVCHYGTAWSELERGKCRGRVTRDDNGHVSWELGIYLSRALGTTTSTSIQPGRPRWPGA